MGRIRIEGVLIKEHYSTISQFMLYLHDNERVLFDKTAHWEDIETDYMAHVIEMQEEADGLCLVAYVDDVPAGFIFGYLEDEDESRFEIAVGRVLYISEGYVYPQYRKMGIYRQLNEQLEAHYLAMGIKRITRFTLANNEPMKSFLEGAGYHVIRLLYEKWV